MYEKRWLCWLVWKWYERSIAFRIATVHAQENFKGSKNPVHKRQNRV